jgi:hypothetical protein
MEEFEGRGRQRPSERLLSEGKSSKHCMASLAVMQHAKIFATVPQGKRKLREDEVKIATACGRHLVETRDGLGKPMGERAKRVMCSVVRRRFVPKFLALKGPNAQVLREDPDMIRRWGNQKQEEPSLAGAPNGFDGAK